MNRISLAVLCSTLLLLFSSSCFGDDGDSVAGTWITNRGVLELSTDDGKITGTLDSKTEISGTISSGEISFQYKKSRITTNVTLDLDASGRWISGESKTGNSTGQWFGCRSIATAGDNAADFSGHWLLSWGIMQLTQTDAQINGRFGADDYGKIDGDVVGARLNLQWRQHRSKGKAWIEQSPDGKHLIGRTTDTNKPSTIVGVRADGFQHHSEPIAGKTVQGFADNGMLYYLRMPDDWKQGQTVDVVTLLHGSNFTTAGMVGVVAKKWPDIAKRFAILGIQGERWAKWSSAKDLRFNYSYVNWMGRSTYRGFPFTDRESPALVMNVINELDQQYSFERVFVGGHSQGGYLTYVLHMHFPEQLAGTFPIAAGLIMQAEPTAFDDQPLRKAQRNTPMVIIHGTRDSVVRPSASTYTHKKFRAHDFPLVKRLSPNAGHAFDFLPVGDAIKYLDAVTSSDVGVLADFAEQKTEDEEWHDVVATVLRARELGMEEQLQESFADFEAAAEKDAATHLNAVESNTDGSWIDSFLPWYDQFAASAAAKPAVEAFNKLRAAHTPKAKQLETEARKAFRAKKADEGWDKYREIIDNFYASPQYRMLAESVKKHFELK